MPATLVSLTGSIFMLGSVHAACSLALTEQIASVEWIVGSLRPDKAGQMRVFASDGSEFTAGQAQWMTGQLRGIQRECTKRDDQSAAAQLQSVQELLKAHRRT